MTPEQDEAHAALRETIDDLHAKLEGDMTAQRKIKTFQAQAERACFEAEELTEKLLHVRGQLDKQIEIAGEFRKDSARLLNLAYADIADLHAKLEAAEAEIAKLRKRVK